MYDQEKAINFSTNDLKSSVEAADFLIDFSKGPQAMMVTLVKKTATGVQEENRDYRILEIDGNSSSSPKQEPRSDQPIKPTTTLNISTTATVAISTSTTSATLTTTSTTTKKAEPATKPRAICTFCGKAFSHLGDYNKHRRRHTGERPYDCDQCLRKFAHASNLARHKRLHSGEKPFQCTVCDKRFSRKDKLSSHVARKSCGRV